MLNKIKLELYKLVCRYNNWMVQRDLPKYTHYIKEWANIDRKKDKSLSADDFRFWVYLQENRRIGSKLKLT